MNAPDALELTVIAAGVTLVGLAIGFVVLHALRTRSVRVQIAAIVGVTVASVLVGVYVAARKMFISEHDLTVLVVVLLAAGVAGMVGALVIGARFGAASRALIATARGLGADGTGAESNRPARPAPAELADLAGELAATRARLDEARARQAALESSRRELVAWVSHDLRTPLAGMRAIVEALEDGMVGDPETVARYLRTLREEVDLLATLVDDLFELSRTQAGVLRLAFERVSLGDLVSDAVAGATPVADAKGVQIVGRLSGPPADVMVSAPEVLRALRNLLENAIRHTPTDTAVVVEAGVDDDRPEWVQVVVRDHGGGIPADEIDRVFDIGFQGDAARATGRAGLGLAIAKGFVEAHAGMLTVRNDNGGAAFMIRLPRVLTP